MKIHHFIFAAMLLTVLWAGQSFAARVEVFIPFEEPGAVADMAMRQKALEKGFSDAVFNEAKAMLSGTLPQERAEIIYEFLASEAEKYILGYQESEVDATDEGLSMTLEVEVNQAELKNRLVETGIYATSSRLQPFFMNMSGGAPDDWVALSRLQKLSGVISAHGASPVFSAMQAEQGAWTGTLKDGEAEWSAKAPDLTSLWFVLWRGYFTKEEALARKADTTIISVRGWYTPDGARAFDRVLAGWPGLVESPVMASLVLSPVAIEGHWQGRVRDVQALEARLMAYCAMRGLSYKVGEAQEYKGTTATASGTSAAGESAEDLERGEPAVDVQAGVGSQ